MNLLLVLKKSDLVYSKSDFFLKFADSYKP